MTTMNRFEIYTGDWSEDGHGKYDKFVVNTLASLELLTANYVKNSKEIGIDLSTVARQYEDSSMDLDDYEKLRALGMSDEYEDDLPYDGVMSLNPKLMAAIYMFLCTYSAEGTNIPWEFHEDKTDGVLIGMWSNHPGQPTGLGYGLYY